MVMERRCRNAKCRVQGKVGRLMCSPDDRCSCKREVQEALICKDRAARQR